MIAFFRKQSLTIYVILCKHYVWLKFCYHLLAAMALIIGHSIYIGQLMQASTAPLITRMGKHQRGVAYVRQNPYPAFELFVKLDGNGFLLLWRVRKVGYHISQYLTPFLLLTKMKVQ